MIINKEKEKKKIVNKTKQIKNNSPSKERFIQQRSPDFPKSFSNNNSNLNILNKSEPRKNFNSTNPLNQFFKNNFSMYNLKSDVKLKESIKINSEICSDDTSNMLLNAFIKKTKEANKDFQFVNDSFGISSFGAMKNQTNSNYDSDIIRNLKDQIKYENNISNQLKKLQKQSTNKILPSQSLNQNSCFKRKKLLNRSSKK